MKIQYRYYNRYNFLRYYCYRVFIIVTCLVFVLFFTACNSELKVVVPDIQLLNSLQSSIAVPNNSRRLVEGVYVVESGAEQFGDTVILKHDREWLSIFCEKNSSYIVMQSGMRDSSIFYAGYWRYAQSPRTGLCTLEIKPDDGAAEMLRTNTRPQRLVIRGVFGGNESVLPNPLILRFVRGLYIRSRVKFDGRFWIIAQRGGGRNSDRLPFSENSAELIKFAGKLGANGVEIDVRLTKDGVPVLYHDENLNTRLIDGEYVVGPIGNYTYTQIQELCRLKNGERIPTLDDVLKAIVDSTALTAVWLDIKEVGEIEKVIPMQKKYIERAKALQELGKRDSLEIFFGLANQDIYNAFTAHPDHKQVPSICELSINQTQMVNSKVYAPRWTLGSLQHEVSLLHADNRRSFVWTLDQPEFIVKFLNEGDFDGILTNYPTVVAYHYYIRR